MNIKSIIITCLSIVFIAALLELRFTKKLLRFASTEEILDIYMYLPKEKFPDDVILFNFYECDVDSIRKWAKIIDNKNPKLIVIDCLFSDLQDSSTTNIELKAPFALPMIIYNDSIKYSANIFNSKPLFGVTNFSTTQRYQPWITFDNVAYPSMPQLMAGSYKAKENFKAKDKIINWNKTSTPTFVYDRDWLPEDLTDKIVLMGYFGSTSTTKQVIISDYKDVHSSPFGEIFGPTVILNVFNTIKYNPITEIPFWLNLILAGSLAFISMSISKIILKRLTLIRIVFFFFILLAGVTLIYIILLPVFFNTAVLFDLELISLAYLVSSLVLFIWRISVTKKLIQNDSK